METTQSGASIDGRDTAAVESALPAAASFLSLGDRGRPDGASGVGRRRIDRSTARGCYPLGPCAPAKHTGFAEFSGAGSLRRMGSRRSGVVVLVPTEVIMFQKLMQFIREEDGAAASEYAILVAFIAAAVAVAVKLFNLSDIFTKVSENVIGWISSAPTAP